MRMLALLAALALSGCAATTGSPVGGAPSASAQQGRAPYKGPSSMPSRFCTYGSSFDQPGETDVVCF